MNRRVFPAICCRQPGKVKFDLVVKMLSMLSSVFVFPWGKTFGGVEKKKLVPLHWSCFETAHAV